MLQRTAFMCYIFGGAIIPFVARTYENLALRKSAWQLHSYLGLKYSANRAVDGKRSNLAWWEGQCTSSVFGHSIAEWRVDLGNYLSIHHIFIQYETNNQVWDKDNINSASFLGFSIYISNTTNKKDGVLCFRDINYTRATIPNPVNITCPYHGRYVIFYNNRTHPPYPAGYSKFAVNDICEIEVYGCPNQGYYGENCALPCPENCRNGVCHIVNGTCFGCSPGYKGMMCDKGQFISTKTISHIFFFNISF
ncbi:uncharacterized protein LOC144623938 [Crassostrea virginica]